MAIWLLFCSLVGCVDKSLESRNVVWIGKIDDINCHIVLLEPHAYVFEVFLRSSNWMTYKYNNSLSLGFVLAMLK